MFLLAVPALEHEVAQAGVPQERASRSPPGGRAHRPTRCREHFILLGWGGSSLGTPSRPCRGPCERRSAAQP